MDRANLAARLDLQGELSTAQVQQQLADLSHSSDTAADLMTSPAITLRAADSVGQAIAQMVQQGLKRLPVVDDLGRLVGWVSCVDVLRLIEHHQLGSIETQADSPHSGMTVADLMYRDVPTVGPLSRPEEIVQALERIGRRRAVVVDEERHVLGIITDGDLIKRSQLAHHPGLLAQLRGLFIGRPLPLAVHLLDSTETASKVTTTPVITITLATPIREALQLMLQYRIKRLPVVDLDGRLIGLLGRATLLQGLLERPKDEWGERLLVRMGCG